MIGFSAGGHPAAAVSTHFDQRTDPPVDAADRENSRPAFAIVAYPGHRWAHEDETHLDLRPGIHVSAETPPTFLLQAEDDEVDGVEPSLAYYVALQKARVPAEMHLYALGGHAFGLRPSTLPIAQWPRLAGILVADHRRIENGFRTLTAGPLGLLSRHWVGADFRYLQGPCPRGCCVA